MKKKWNEKISLVNHQVISIQQAVTALEIEKENIFQNYKQTPPSSMKDALLKEYEALNEKIKQAKKERDQAELGQLKLGDFAKYVRYFIEHVDELLVDKSNPANQEALFTLVFDQLPTWDQIVNRTAQITPVFTHLRQFGDEKFLMVAPRGIEPLLQE